MKRFEFRLQRVLDLRRQQGDLERAKLQRLIALQQNLVATSLSIVQEVQHATESMKQSASVFGEELMALALFERQCQKKLILLTKQKTEISQQIKQQQAVVREAERKVKLLENLKAKRLSEWSAQSNKELEELAADSHLARISSDRRWFTD